MIGALSDGISTVLDKFIPDADKRLEAEQLIGKQIADNANKQLEVAKVEAAHKSVFVAGWRPAVGWVCASAFAANFVLIPLARSFAPLFGVELPEVTLDLGEMLPVLLGMLGLGGMRSWEKKQGVSTNSIAGAVKGRLLEAIK